MLLSRTVVPHGATGALDTEDVGALAGRDGLLSAEEAGDCAVHQRRAGRVEGGLSDRVLASVEVELNPLARGNRDAAGLHLQGSLANGDDSDAILGLGSGRSARGRRAASGAGAGAAAVAVAGASEREEGKESRGEHGELHGD